MARTLYGEPERFVETYWSRFGEDTYLVGDAARIDEDGYFWLMGRVDDVIFAQGYGNGALLPKDAKALLRRIGEFEEEQGALLTGPILWMNGADHLMPMPWVPEALGRPWRAMGLLAHAGFVTPRSPQVISLLSTEKFCLAWSRLISSTGQSLWTKIATASMPVRRPVGL